MKQHRMPVRRPTCASPVLPLLGGIVAVLLSACATHPPAPSTAGSAAAASAGGTRAGAAALRPLRAPATALSPYLRIQPQQTGLVNAGDDGRNTYIAFSRAVPDEIAIWDHEGRMLAFARSGPIVAVSGVHKGLLIRVGAGNSFLAPNPRAVPSERPALDDDPDLAEALSRLEGEASQLGAFRRALERVDASAAETPATGASVAVPAATWGQTGTPAAAAAPLVAGAAPAPQGLVPAATAAPPSGVPAFGAGVGPGGVVGRSPAVGTAGAGPLRLAAAGTSSLTLAPAGAALAGTASPTPAPASSAAPASALPGSSGTAAGDDTVYQRLPNGALVRVFFASGSRAIVRPDDGLARLEDEARTADEVRIVGFTDSTGSIAANTALSQVRAFAIRSLLVQRGVAPERISVAGLPATQYLADNVTEKGRALNRRVEVQLLRRAQR